MRIPCLGLRPQVESYPLRFTVTQMTIKRLEVPRLERKRLDRLMRRLMQVSVR